MLPEDAVLEIGSETLHVPQQKTVTWIRDIFLEMGSGLDGRSILG